VGSPVILRGQSIQLRLDPQGGSPIEIWHKDQCHGQAARCDKQLNANHFNSRNYDC
jgi:hypothetical protein